MKLHLHWSILLTVYISRKRFPSCIIFFYRISILHWGLQSYDQVIWTNHFLLLWQCCKNVCAILTRPAAKKPDNAAQCLSHVGKTMGGIHCLDASTGVPSFTVINPCLTVCDGSLERITELKHFINRRSKHTVYLLTAPCRYRKERHWFYHGLKNIAK